VPHPVRPSLLDHLASNVTGNLMPRNSAGSKIRASGGDAMAAAITAAHAAGRRGSHADFPIQFNEKVRLYARLGTALIAAREGGQDPFAAITAVIPWELFRASVAEAAALARPEDFVSYERLSEHYTAMRRWAPAFLAAFSFQGRPATAALLRAVDTLRDMNEAASLKLPKSAPTGFIRERWSRYVMPGGEIDRRYYQFCCRSCAAGCAPATYGSQ
jgi:hypothetical protein